MTSTIIFWIKAGIIALMLWAVWNIVKAIRRQKQLIPPTAAHWKQLLSELLFLGLGIFLYFWIEKTFQRQIDVVLNEKNRSLQGLYFSNLQNNQPDSLSAYKGKVVILNLWATWCSPCRRELPALEKLQATYKNELRIVALSDEPGSTIRNFIQQTPLALTVGFYGSYPLLDSLNSRPVSILIDKNNVVKDVVIGARGYDFFEKWVLKERK